ncbi:MAG: T9SS type A sorting domain-containing protein [Saprospiraceae bacterium]|nr:T9SS type A sorting domain-containing protein [Saprospiraceae bacterium]
MRTDIELVPNPASKSVQIIAKGIDKSFEKEIKIFDVTGKLVHTQKGVFNEIDLSKIANGLYVVSIKIRDNIYSEKLIITK